MDSWTEWDRAEGGEHETEVYPNIKGKGRRGKIDEGKTPIDEEKQAYGGSWKS